jgi:hypothetical protein
MHGICVGARAGSAGTSNIQSGGDTLALSLAISLEREPETRNQKPAGFARYLFARGVRARRRKTIGEPV